MSPLRHLSWLAAAVAGSLVLLSSCGGDESGTPTAADTTTTITSAQATPTSPSSPPETETGSDLAELDPCELLTEAERAQLDLPEGKPGTTAGYPACTWNMSGPGIADVTLWPDWGFDDLNAAGRTVTDVTIGSHQGRRLEHDVPGICDFDIAITDSSTVTVGGGHDETGPACELAEQVATLIEPKLPAG